MKWTRPESVPFPSIWHRFEKTTKDGKVHKFYVQDATEDMDVFLLDHMQKNFIRDEPMCKSLNTVEEQESVEGMSDFWRDVLKQRMALVCFEEDPNRPGKPLNFVGCNITVVASKGDHDPDDSHIRGNKWKIIYSAVMHAVGAKDIFSHFNIDTYLSAFGLSVNPNFRGMGIGVEILNARTELCKATGVPITETAFTNIASQIVAERAGFKDFIVKDYEEIEKALPQCHFPGIKTKTIRVMYKEMK